MALQNGIKKKINVNRFTTLLDSNLVMLKSNQSEYDSLKSNSDTINSKIMSFSAVGVNLRSHSKKKKESDDELISFDSSKSQIGKEARMMDSLTSQTKEVFKDNYNVKLSFDGSDDKAKELKDWEDKYVEFESLVNDLKKKIGYPTNSSFDGNEDGENPLIKLIEEIQNMIEFMEAKELTETIKPTPPIDESEPTVDNKPLIIGGLLLGGYLLFK